MLFRVADEVFTRFPETYVGVLVATGIKNNVTYPAAMDRLRRAEEDVRAHYAGSDARDIAALQPWRAAFSTLNIPNRFKSSVEALLLRVLKGDALPDINPLVNLINAVSLRHAVPVGGHDIDRLHGNMEVRFSRAADRFTPFGQSETEEVELGEIVYADAAEVRTRRWVWRQGDRAKVTDGTTRVFIPIDGFQGQTADAVRRAMDDLASLLHAVLGAEVNKAIITREQPSVQLETGPDTSTTPAHAGCKSRREMDHIDELLERGVVNVIVREEIEKRLRTGERLRVKLGIDPTGPRLHIGRAVALRKLRQFQQQGHTICLVIGDFTAQIGDASDKDAQRKILTADEVARNMETYQQQIARILDINKVEWYHNNDWLGTMTFREVIELATHFTVAQMIERENFSDRYATGKPIGLHEFMYPLMQGYDSVAMNVDLELGGTDQLFNMMAGRTIQQAYGQRPQGVMTLSMIYGLDGRKMSTSWGNTILLLDDPVNQYGKIMSMSDELIVPYFEACTDVPLAEIDEVEAQLRGGTNPMTLKKRLAWEIVTLYHGTEDANKAQAEFERVVQGGDIPEDIPTITIVAPDGVQPERDIVSLLVEAGLVPSKSEARRLIEGKAVTINGERATDVRQMIAPQNGMILRAGKRRFARLHLQKE